MKKLQENFIYVWRSKTLRYKNENIISEAKEKMSIFNKLCPEVISINDKKPFIKLKSMPFKGIEYPVSLEYAYFIQKLKA